MQNIRTYCIPLGEVKSDDVVAGVDETTPIFMGVEDSASFSSGYYYDLSDIDSWVEFTLPPAPGSADFDIAQFKTGGGDKFGYSSYSNGWGGGVAPPDGMQVFSPIVNLPDLPAVGPGGFAYSLNYAVFIKVSGSSVYPTYEPPRFGDGIFSLVLRFGPEWSGFRPEVFGSFYADPGTDLKVLVAIGFAPPKPVDGVAFWTNFRKCKEIDA